MIRRTVQFSGRVQGVGFRYSACDLAKRFAVTGTVRNLMDGRVEAVVEGTADEVDRFLHALSDRMRGYVVDIASHDSNATGEFDQFEVRL